MFKEVYKNAYDSKVPDYNVICKIEEVLEIKKKRKTAGVFLQPVAVVCMTFFLLTMIMGLTVVPVMAKEIPGVYRILERYAPKMIEYILPEELSCSKLGIRMQVEAIQTEHKNAEIVVSFTDEEGYDYINGKVDLYDSYRLSSFSGVSNIGGCSFLEYDAEADKAYYKIRVTTFDTFDSERMRFLVRTLLTESVEEEKEISLAEIDFEPELKQVTLNGYSGMGEKEQVTEYFGESDDFSYRHAAKVLDTGEWDSSLVDQLTITGIAYDKRGVGLYTVYCIKFEEIHILY